MKSHSATPAEGTLGRLPSSSPSLWVEGRHIHYVKGRHLRSVIHLVFWNLKEISLPEDLNLVFFLC